MTGKGDTTWNVVLEYGKKRARCAGNGEKNGWEEKKGVGRNKKYLNTEQDKYIKYKIGSMV